MKLPLRRSASSRENWTATLPRDTRDTLFLLAVIAWVVMMQVPHIPGWCSALTACVLVWQMPPSIQKRFLSQVGPVAPGKDALAAHATSTGIFADWLTTRRSPV